MAKYYIDGVGNYVGAFDNGALPTAGTFEVQIAPPDGRAIWNGIMWIIPKDVNQDIIEAQRLKALKDQGITLEMRVAALEAKIMKNDSAQADAVQAAVAKTEVDFPNAK